MNIYNNPWQRQMYGSYCPYMDMCPVRAQCPYCPHRQESDNYMNHMMYGNVNMGMGYHKQEYYPMEYQNIMYNNYGYDPMTNMYAAQMPEEYDMVMPEYTQDGYINPYENINSPWANNNMYMEKKSENPLPLPDCPFK